MLYSAIQIYWKKSLFHLPIPRYFLSFVPLKQSDRDEQLNYINWLPRSTKRSCWITKNPGIDSKGNKLRWQ